jgi:PhnB protein
MARAVSAGAEALRPVVDQFFGTRNGILRDPFGHRWIVATRTAEVGRVETLEPFEAIGRGRRD